MARQLKHIGYAANKRRSGNEQNSIFITYLLIGYFFLYKQAREKGKDGLKNTCEHYKLAGRNSYVVDLNLMHFGNDTYQSV